MDDTMSNGVIAVKIHKSALAAVTILTACAPGAAAALLSPFAAGSYSYCLDQSGAPSLGPNCNLSTVYSGTATDTATLSGGGSSLAFAATASGSYGQLHADVTSTVTAGATPTLARASAEASFEDILTVNFAPFTGEVGFFTIDYTLEGTTSETGIDTAFAQVGVDVDSFLTESYRSPYYTGSPNSIVDIPMTFTFIYGQPFGLEFDLTADTGTITQAVSGTGYTTNYLANVTGTGSAHFGDTLVLSGLTILNPADGSVVSGAQITSGSGTQYGPNGVVVSPEPSSDSLLVAGLCVFLLPVAVVRSRARTRKGATKLYNQKGRETG
jgi:hypothetical protein